MTTEATMPSYDTQWLPYLSDTVSVRVGDQDLTGTTTRYDASLVEVGTAVAGLQLGQEVGVAWRVGADVHRGTAQVVELTDAGFSVRLPPAPAATSRRTHERVSLSLPLVLSATQHGSYGSVPHQARSLDLSNSGLRAIIDGNDGFGVGEILRVEVELGGNVEVLLACVVWETGHGAGERLAGLRFQDEVQATSWLALSRVG